MFSALSLYQVSRLKELLCSVPLPLRLQNSSLYFIVEFVTLCLVRVLVWFLIGLVAALVRYLLVKALSLVTASLMDSRRVYYGVSLPSSTSVVGFISGYFLTWFLVLVLGSIFLSCLLDLWSVFFLQSQSFLLIGFRFGFCIIIWFCIDLFLDSILTIEMLPLPAGPSVSRGLESGDSFNAPFPTPPMLLSLFLFVILI